MDKVAYLRYSSDAQKEASIEQQLREIENYCKLNNYNLVKIYSDYALSGKYDYRPQFEQMLKDSTKGFFDGIIVFDLSRFSRGGEQGIADELVLRNNNVKIISVTENFTDDLGGKIVKSIKYLMNEEYLNQLSLNVQRGQKDNALKGLWNGGTPPLGYDVKDQKLVINELEKDAVKIIFENFASGKAVSEICDILNAKGYRTKKYNRLFNTTSLYDILRNEKYIGKLIYKKTKRLSKSKKIKQPEFNQIILDDAVPRLIDDGLWSQCQKRIHSNVRVNKSTSKVDYLLTGLIKCGECGANYVGNGRRVKHYKDNDVVYYYYTCSHKNRKDCRCNNKQINKDILEEVIYKSIVSECYSEKNIENNISLLNNWISTTIETRAPQQEKYKNNIENLKKQKDRIITLTIEGVLSTEECIKRSNEISEKLKALESELQMLNSFSSTNIDDYSNCIYKLKELIDNGMIDSKELIKLHINQIEIKKTTTTVTLNLFPKSEILMLSSGVNFGADERT